jgi:DNA polymerase III sliding clamp (beta) subunit (PCNA family)
LRGGLLIRCEAEVHRTGSFALLFDGLYEQIVKLVVKENTPGEIQIIPSRAKSSQDHPAKSTFSLNVQETTYRWTVPSFEPDELSKYFDKKRTAKTTLEIGALVLKDMLGRVMHCINPGEVRTAMRGILFKVDAENLTMAGTNGVKMSEVSKHHNGFSGSAGEVLVPFHTGSLLAALIRKDSGIVSIGASEEFIFFKLDSISLIGVPIRDAKYPDYPPLFRRAENSFTIPIVKLKEISANLARVADPEDNYRLTVKTDGNLISFQTEKGKTEFSAAGGKGKMDLDMNAKFLSDLARAMEGREVEVRHPSSDNYITFHPDGDGQRALLTTVNRREPGKPQEKAQEKREPGKAE